MSEHIHRRSRADERYPHLKVVTQAHLRETELRLLKEIEQVRKEVEQVRAELRIEIEQLRSELRTEIEQLRGDVRTQIAQANDARWNRTAVSPRCASPDTAPDAP